MLDDVEYLTEEKSLCRLLGYYVDAGAPDRQVWIDRCGELAGAEGRELARLHGTLLAFGWLEQNTGSVLPDRPGAQCYRATRAGQRALAQCLADREEENAETFHTVTVVPVSVG